MQLPPDTRQVGNGPKVLQENRMADNGALKPEETGLASARFQGRRVAELAAQFIDGRKKT